MVEGPPGRLVYWSETNEQVRLKSDHTPLAHRDTGPWTAEDGEHEDLVKEIVEQWPEVTAETLCMLISNRLRGMEVSKTEVERS